MENSFTVKSTIAGFSSERQSNFNRNLYEGLSLDAVQSFPGISDERINYMGYFNTHEINMLNLLNEKAAKIKKDLRAVIVEAEVDCRRDYLWKCFLPVSFSGPPISAGTSTSSGTFSSSTNSSSSTGTTVATGEVLTMDLLDEMLVLVQSIRFDDYDLNLSQFYQFNHNWYKVLAQKLENRFESCCRRFVNEQQFKLMLFKHSCKDCFVLFEWNIAAQAVVSLLSFPILSLF